MNWLWLSLYHALAMLWATSWALVLGFTISGVLQVFVGKERMSHAFGRANLKSVSIATGLGAAIVRWKKLNAGGVSITNLLVTATLKRTGQVATVAVSIVAWFSISNHCALGGLLAAKTAPAKAQMDCHGGQPSPSKKSSDEEMPCCKLLRATLAKTNDSTASDASVFVLLQYLVAALFFGDDVQHASSPEELDTGPPFAASFAESVLQRSLLAHAPPVLA